MQIVTQFTTYISLFTFIGSLFVSSVNMAAKGGLGSKMDDCESPQTQDKKLAESVLKFTLSLFKQNELADVDNVIISPFSISIALGMTLAGAKKNTADQMKEVLNLGVIGGNERIHDEFRLAMNSLSEAQNSGIKSHLANRMYVQSDMKLLSPFESIVEKYYSSQTAQVNFTKESEKVRLEINKWVEEQTATRIKDLLPPGILNSLTRLVLVNAIYFKGDWAKKFDPKDTIPQDFFVSGSKQITVDMMHTKAEFPYGYSEELNCEILELPYVNRNLSMFIILPKEKLGLKELEANLTPQIVSDLVFYMSDTKVIVSLPKFKVDSSFSLKNTLTAMGMEDLFTEKKADLSGIDGQKVLYVSAVVHKAFVEVNEEGSEAAAATAAVMMMRCMRIEPRFTADHPFIYFIRDNKSGCILFWGRITEPSSA